MRSKHVWRRLLGMSSLSELALLIVFMSSLEVRSKTEAFSRSLLSRDGLCLQFFPEICGALKRIVLRRKVIGDVTRKRS